MRADLTETPELDARVPRLVTNIAGAVLAAVAMMLAVVFFGGDHFTAADDPVLGVSSRIIVGVLVMLFLVIELVCLLADSLWLKGAALLWLVVNLAVYLCGWPWPGSRTNLGVYLAPVDAAFGLPPGGAYYLLAAVFIYLMFAGLPLLIWPWVHPWLNLPTYLKMACPACGVHIRFDTRNLGQKMPCPQCRAALALGQQSENLKMSCFFCKEHIEFPAHAIGTKMTCPHCKMDITLKEPV